MEENEPYLSKNINILRKIGNGSDNYYKHYICYNEMLNRDKNLTGFILEECYSKLSKSDTVNDLTEKIKGYGIELDFTTYKSSLNVDTFDLKQFRKCEKKINCLHEISKEDIENIFSYDPLIMQNETQIMKIANATIPPENKYKNFCNSSAVYSEKENCFEEIKSQKHNYALEAAKDIDHSKTYNNFIYRNSERQNFYQMDFEIEKQNDVAFRTARDEFSIQNSKKYGGETSANNFTYGNIKKTLGTRRSGRSDFVAPFKRDNKVDCNEVKENENMIDERLFNIDPKMIELINNEIINNLEKITWDDIAGLEYAKATIQEAIIWPILRPDIFTGIRRPPKGILFFGPPGTGKTLIGKCIASQSNSKFFSISASSLTSKWIGEGEKMVRALFAVAAVNQPSVIFVDEIDSLLCQRSESEHESSRRLKTEFLVQFDGAATSKDDRVLIIGATNRPHELDDAARRRFVRRLYIPLPNEKARIIILENLLKNVKNVLSKSDYEIVSKITGNYSGADMASLCQEACMEPLRAIPVNEMMYFDKNNVRPVVLKDFQESIKKIRPSVSIKDLNQYLEWDKLYGSGES